MVARYDVKVCDNGRREIVDGRATHEQPYQHLACFTTHQAAKEYLIDQHLKQISETWKKVYEAQRL